MATGTETALAAQLAEDAAERFLRYVRIDTQSDEDSESYPSTEKQLDLLRLLLEELQQLGLPDATMDERGYVTATLPATVDHDVPTIAFFAAADPLRGRRDPARLVRPDDPAGGVAATGPPRRPRRDHDRRHHAARR